MPTVNRAGFRGDTRWLSVPAMLVMAAVAAAAFALSYQGLATVSVAAGVAPWILPLFLDGGIAASGLVRAMLRGQKRKTWFAVLLLVSATLVSSGINLLVHTTRGDDLSVVLTASLAPVFFLGFTELMIFAVVQHDVIERERKPRVKRASVSAAPVSVAVEVAAPLSDVVKTPTARARTERSQGATGAELPFDDVLARDEATLREDLIRLAADPASSEPRTEESRLMSATVWALVDRHGHSIAALSREVGHANPDRLRDRIRHARKKAPVLEA